MTELQTEDGLVSIVIPCYNRAHLVRETLESVAAQTYGPIEVIVVDDGSSDNSVEVVQEWIESNGTQHRNLVRLECLSQKNAGPSAARNAGLRVSSGEFIQFLDSDDLLHPEKLTRQVAALQESDADFCVCNYQSFRDGLSTLGSVCDFYGRSHKIDDFPEQYPMDTPAPLYRKEVILRNGPWDEVLDAGEDFEYNFRIVARGAKGIWLSETLLYVRKHDGAERRQATPLATRCRSMYIGLVKMEMEAVGRGLCSRRLRNSFGVRAHQYYRHLQAEGSIVEAEVFLRFAQSRLFWTTRASLFAKRVLPAPIIQLCVVVKMILRGDEQ